jgi:acid phosphatase (class A)
LAGPRTRLSKLKLATLHLSSERAKHRKLIVTMTRSPGRAIRIGGMRQARALAVFVLLSLGALGLPAFAYEPAYVSTLQVDLAKLLPPPPLPDSAQQKQDLDEVLRAQQARSPEQADQTVKDNDASLEQIVDHALGDSLSPERVPKLTALFNRTIGDVRAIFFAAKDVWNRPRPFVVDPDEVHAIGQRPASGSYPSGHATRGWLAAILLANMVPEKSTELFARGREYGQNRVVAGVHFPSDVEAGRLSATAIMTALIQNESFRRDFAAARTELREVLGYPK